MAVPTGILGGAIEAKTKEHLGETRTPTTGEIEESGLERLPGCLRSRAWMVITFLLAYGSVCVYFLSTSKYITKMIPADDDDDPTDFEYKDGVQWFGGALTFIIPDIVVALTDGIVAAVFLIEFCVRAPSGTLTMGHALVDFLAFAP